MVDAGGGVLRGEVMLAGFIALAPEEERKKHLDLLLSMRDPEFVRRYAEFEDWFKHTQDIAGAFYLWIVEHLFVGNELVAGTLQVGGDGSTWARSAAPSRSWPARAITSRPRSRRSRWPAVGTAPDECAASSSTAATRAVHGPRGVARALGAALGELAGGG